jgi:hypothetical protein
MAKIAAFAKTFVGRWRIVEMDTWDKDFLDLVEKAHITFRGRANGEIAFGAPTAISMSVTAPAKVRPARSSPGKATTKAIPSVAAVGSSTAPLAVSSAISISTKATTLASSPNVTDFFNSLLVF